MIIRQGKSHCSPSNRFWFLVGTFGDLPSSREGCRGLQFCFASLFGVSTIVGSKGLVIRVCGRSGSSSVWYSEGRSVLVSVVSSSSRCELHQEYVLSWFCLSIRVSHRVRLRTFRGSGCSQQQRLSEGRLASLLLWLQVNTIFTNSQNSSSVVA